MEVNDFSNGWRKVCVGVQSCLTVCHPIDCSLPGFSVRRILQARILEWVAIFSPRGSSWPRDQTHVSCVGRWILYHWVSREALLLLPYTKISLCTTWMIPLHLVLCLEIRLHSFGKTHWIVHLKWLNFLLIITQRSWLTKPNQTNLWIGFCACANLVNWVGWLWD